MSNVGIIGSGFVGGSIAKGMQFHHEVRVYDIDKNKCTHSFEDTVNTDFVFICVPTPMKSVEGSEANLSILYSFFDRLSNENLVKKNTVYIVKSTIPIGTIESLINKYGISNIVHSPEFLTARTAAVDFITPSRNIVGGEDEESVIKVKKLFENRFPGVPCYTMPSKEAEMVKYMCNCFYATKVMFFNEMFLFAEKLNLSWEDVMTGIMSSGWVTHMHNQVPGHDGKLGFGGTCFPKDINAMISVMEKHGIEPHVLKGVWKQNLNVRPEMDWGKESSAVRPE